MTLPVRLELPSQPASIVVERVQLASALSEPWLLQVDALLDDPCLSFTEVMGQSARLTLEDQAWCPSIEGLVAGVQQTSAEPGGLSGYHLTIAPPAWLATRGREHRIFQHVSADALAREVLARYGQKVSSRLTESREEREYVVQYGETDLAFVQRLLAEEGIVFFFDLESGDMILADETRAELGPAASLPYRRTLNHNLREAHVHAVSRSAVLAAGRLMRTDFDPDKPRFLLGANAPEGTDLYGPEGKLEVHAHDPAQFTDVTKGERLAQYELEAVRAAARSMTLGTSVLLFPGAEITLSQAPLDDASAPLLVTRAFAQLVQAQDAAPRWAVSLAAQPKSVPYRVARIDKPRIAGTHTALVVGESGQEIDVDEQGRVLVAFSWDRRGLREGAPTRRVRVSQAWAGPGYGLVTLPRIGNEVVISYLDGDPDEPLIIGRVHNAVAPSPLKLPQEKTRSIWRSRSTPGGEGGNHLLFEDQAGGELVELFGQRDMKVHALRDADITFGQNARQSVGANHDISVQGDQRVSVSGNQSTSVGAAMNTQSATYSLKSGPIGVQGDLISLLASGTVAAQATTVSLSGSATVVLDAPDVVASGSGTATVSAPVATLAGSAVASVNGAIVTVQGVSIVLGSATTIEIGGAAAVTVSAPSVTVNGSGTTNVGGGTVNVNGSTVNLKGGTVNIN